MKDSSRHMKTNQFSFIGRIKEKKKRNQGQHVAKIRDERWELCSPLHCLVWTGMTNVLLCKY